MAQDAAELNDLIGSRICHDLISPLGAIGNGVELLSMAGITAVPEITLISESVQNANARIRFFRVAFGAASSEAKIGQAEVKRVLADLYRGNRMRVDWKISEDTRRVETKLAFLLIQCFESAFPWGGRVTVTRTGTMWSLHGMAERMKAEVPLWELISNPKATAEVSASSVHFALVAPTARAAGRQVRQMINGSSISVSF